MNRVHTVKTILWALTGIAAAVGVTRFAYGLGATTNLTDATPWGIWIGFDVMAGVALAAGGFVMTALFYALRREEFHSMVRPAVLTAFLGYIAVVAGLLFDLGLPWNIWHMMIYWNLHSPLFEVGWCVMLYTTVLLLEFSPVPLEETSRYAKVRTFLLRFRFPLVLLGIMLSTLHQSSLGSLFLIMPFRLHPLWYSQILPLQFFISAVALGMMMVSLESLASHWLYRRSLQTEQVGRLGKWASWVLLIYLAVKLGDLGVTGKFSLLIEGSWESGLYLAELFVSAIIPIVLFTAPRLRRRTGMLWLGSALVVFGMVFNRLNVGGITMLRATGDSYVPMWTEIAVSLGVVSAAALAFMFFIEHFRIWESRPRHPESALHSPASFDHSSEVWLGIPAVAARTKYSLAFVIAFAVAFAALPAEKLYSQGVQSVTSQKARGGEVLFIDSNRDLYGVSFPHARHITKTELDCVRCHHMNIPLESETGCFKCHRSAYGAADVFRHDWHSSPTGGNVGCNDCHMADRPRLASTAKQCDACHINLVPEGAVIAAKVYLAPAYVDAMHALCVTCHREKAPTSEEFAGLGECSTCHQKAAPERLNKAVEEKFARPTYNHLVMPRPDETP